MADKLTYRTLINSDREVLLALQSRVLSALPDPRWYFPSEEWEMEHWFETGEAIGCFEDSTLCGFGVLSPAEGRENHSYACALGQDPQRTFDFHDVMVDVPYRRRGIHTRLIALFTEIVRNRGGRAIYATVDPENAPSRRNFERAGFLPQATQPAYDGRPRVYYRLTLKPLEEPPKC